MSEPNARPKLMRPDELAPSGGLLNNVLNQLDATLLGQPELHRMVLVGILSRGHILLEGMPGVGKTALIHVLGQLLSLKFNRVQFTADFPLAGDQVATATIDLGPLGKITMPPVRLLYSPEYRPRTGDGRDTLRTLANITGGVPRTELAGIWSDLPTVDRRVSIAHWLWLLAVVTILLEVVERRTGWVSASVPQSVTVPTLKRTRSAEDTPGPGSPKTRILRRTKTPPATPLKQPVPPTSSRPSPPRTPGSSSIGPPARRALGCHPGCHPEYRRARPGFCAG